jgi:hypothetical protein
LTYESNTISLTAPGTSPFIVLASNTTTIPNASKFVIQGFKGTTTPENVLGVLSVYAEQGPLYWRTLMRTRHVASGSNAVYTIYYYGLS